MWCEVPDDVDVVPEETQVEAFQFDAANFPQVPILDQLTQFIDGRIILERVSDHQHPLLLVRYGNQFLRFWYTLQSVASQRGRASRALTPAACKGQLTPRTQLTDRIDMDQTFLSWWWCKSEVPVHSLPAW